ncbi:hypothetical protein HUA74_09160 [Myxococcus sp. CA051A]|uniref:Lipoprotein n=1 Tax=Myxococcus fulvus TaxID=33 RepID=A0A3S7V0H0_MYXFU|nr:MULTISPECIES: hypothetical protein [unclassified Myxococcus]AYM54484.1 hypothetical protein [Myxococcus fulvus]NTX11556.1 hypothetical protein [Myxococcus sp. CA056]NTX34346.1 hypothetical protein [Myxococcus sp. CA033]NTX50372.1 hypothetical protein [Myxococcus sp. CA039A]NTX60826.1 hypothetical protein [Myxococcus sp. CA051A]
MWTAFRPLPAALSLVFCWVLFTGCDSGKKQFQEANAQYEALVDRGVPPTDPAWDAVVASLEKVPAGSRSRPEADKRLSAIRGLRGSLPPRPLATPGATGPGTSEADVKRAACEALAKKLGQASDEATREPLHKALEQCHADLVRLEAKSHPPGEEGHEHGSPPH